MNTLSKYSSYQNIKEKANMEQRIFVFFLNINLVIALGAVCSGIIGNIIGGNIYTQIYRLIYYGSLGIVALYCYGELLKERKIKADVLLITLVYIVVLLISLFTLPDFSNSINDAMVSIGLVVLVALPTLYLSSRVSNWSLINHLFKPYIVLSIVYSIVVLFVPNNTEMGYNQISSALIIPTISAMVYFFIEKKRWTIIAVLLNFAVIFLKGSRAPLLGIIGTFAVVLIWSTKKITAKVFLLYLLLILLGVGVVFFRNEIIEFLLQQFPESRTIFLLSNITNKELFDTGRKEVINSVFSLISQRRISGYGPFGAAYYLSLELGASTLQKGVYAHNIFLDFILHYGCIIGGGLIVAVVIYLKKCFSYVIKNSELILIFSIIFGGYLQLMVSGSYIGDQMFWLSIGCFVSMKHNKMLNESANNNQSIDLKNV